MIGMTDPYEKVWEEIRKGFDLNIKMIKWIAERTLSVKDYKEFLSLNDLMLTGLNQVPSTSFLSCTCLIKKEKPAIIIIIINLPFN